MPHDFAIRFKDFSGGDWGEQDPAKAASNQFHGTNVGIYSDGTIGVRPGWKLMDLTGKVANPPATYSGIVRGFEVMDNKLTMVLDTKSVDIYWDLSLAPGGVLPNVQPATMQAGIGVLAYTQLIMAADTGTAYEFNLTDGILAVKQGSPPVWTPLSGVSGAVAPPAPFSVIARWGLYLVAVDRNVPWRIWFTLVDSAGPHFLNWGANNFVFIGTTNPITTLMPIFNMLYCGKASGWWGISGVLGIQASVRELAIGNGPLDQRSSSVTTDSRIIYWPLQKVPTFFNGGRVQLVNPQRMDPRTTWYDSTPAMARTSPNVGWSATYKRIAAATSTDLVATPTVLRDIGTPTWTASPSRAADSGAGSFNAAHNLADGTPMPMPPGWSSFGLGLFGSGAPQAWVATDATNTAWRTTVATGPVAVYAVGTGPAAFPTGSVMAFFVNDVEIARTNVTKPGTALSVWTETSFAINDVLSVRFYNPDPVNPVNFTATIQAPSGTHRPRLSVLGRPAEATGDHWLCPATGRYDIHVETCGGQAIVAYQILVNRRPVASCTPGYQTTADDFTLNTMDANNVALTTGDAVTIGVLTWDYTSPSKWVNRVDGAEGTAMPYLRATNRATQQQVGTLGMFGDSVVVTPTERRLLLAGDDGATTKMWVYGDGVWTHHEIPMLLAGMAPADVRGAYKLPEHVVFATKRTFNAEPLKVWSVMHDLDRPAFVTDQWASPWDQNMPVAGAFQDVLVKGDVAFPAWFDSQGRQVRVRSVIVQFRKWDQGIAGGVNQIAARVDSHGPYERGIQPGAVATWTEPMTGATVDGIEDSWRFNVGDQGFGNGFQIVFTALYGVAIKEVVALVDIRTERT